MGALPHAQRQLGVRHHDTNFKSVAQVVQIFTEVISAGGNLLLDFGPLVLRSAL